MTEPITSHSPLQLINEPFYWRNREKPDHDHAILLLHGLGGGVYEMRPLGEELHKQGFSVKGINYPGHEKPVDRMPAMSWQDWYQHVEMSYKKLKADHEKVSLIGFSTGCPLALKLAHCHPVDRLVLLSPFFAIKSPWPSIAIEPLVAPVSQLVEHVPRLSLPIGDPVLRQQAQDVSFIGSFNLVAVKSALELIAEVKLVLPEIQNPTLVIQSSKDMTVCPSGAAYVMDFIGSTHKEIHWLENSNHVITLDTERHTVYEKVLTFFAPLPLQEQAYFEGHR